MQQNSEMNLSQKPRVWVDISTLRDSRDILSGIPRTVFELSYPLLAQAKDLDLRFFGYDEFHHVFVEYSLDFVKALHESKHAVSSTPGKSSKPSRREHLKWSLRDKTKNKLGHFYDPALFFAKSILGLVKAVRKKFYSLRMSFSKPNSVSPFEVGDTVFSACAMWNYPCYCEKMEIEKTAKNLRTIFLIYDIIPIVQPQFFNSSFSKGFESWFSKLVPISDLLLGISDSTVDDILSYSRMKKLNKQIIVRKFLLGFDFRVQAEQKIPSWFRISGEYILTVSTIESRKNHYLLYYIWKQLIGQLSEDKVPDLVIVGKPGFGASELIHLFENDPTLNKKVHILKTCSDSELSGLYSNCLFTVYPSWYEGWGLPITESLSYGKLPLISNTSSMPEAGLGLAITLPPHDVRQWAEKIVQLLENQQLLTLDSYLVASRSRKWSESLDELRFILRSKFNKVGFDFEKNESKFSIEERK